MIQRSLAKKRSGEGGFTLVELLIVIVILGILAAIVVLAIGGLKDSANGAKCDAGAKTLESAQDAFFASHTTGYAVDKAALKTAGLIKSVPTDLDTAGTATGYTVTGTGECDSISIEYPDPTP